MFPFSVLLVGLSVVTESGVDWQGLGAEKLVYHPFVNDGPGPNNLLFVGHKASNLE